MDILENFGGQLLRNSMTKSETDNSKCHFYFLFQVDLSTVSFEKKLVCKTFAQFVNISVTQGT